jgi:hypothetical protein
VKTVILKIFTIYLLGHINLKIYLLRHKILEVYLLGHKTIYLLGTNILTIQLVLTQIPTEKDQVLALNSTPLVLILLRTLKNIRI